MKNYTVIIKNIGKLLEIYYNFYRRYNLVIMEEAMDINHQQTINNIGNTYKDYIYISANEDLSIFNIKLDEFANIELK